MELILMQLWQLCMEEGLLHQVNKIVYIVLKLKFDERQFLLCLHKRVSAQVNSGVTWYLLK